jgi:hypothetical protein
MKKLNFFNFERITKSFIFIDRLCHVIPSTGFIPIQQLTISNKQFKTQNVEHHFKTFYLFISKSFNLSLHFFLINFAFLNFNTLPKAHYMS